MDDIKTVISAVSLLFAYCCFRWNRRENRLDALSAILKPLLRAAQQLNDANSARRSAENLRTAYPDPSAAPEAAHRANQFVDSFNKQSQSASESFKEFERDLGACRFRFPDRVGKMLHNAQEDLAQLGKYVNDGCFDQADVYVAKLIDHYAAIAKHARGWRLADPFEWLKLRFVSMRRKDQPATHEHELTEEQMRGVMELVTRRATTQAQNTFVVHGPQKLLDNPGIAEQDNVIDELIDSVFEVVFQDGTYALLSLPELMTFTYQLIFLAYQQGEVAKMMQHVEHPTKISVSFDFSVNLHVMQPEMVKTLLAKISFSDEPSDGNSEIQKTAS